MVIVADENDLENSERDGLKELNEKSLEYKHLVNDILSAVNWCSNTVNLTRSLQVVDIVVTKLLIDIMSFI